MRERGRDLQTESLLFVYLQGGHGGQESQLSGHRAKEPHIVEVTGKGEKIYFNWELKEPEVEGSQGGDSESVGVASDTSLAVAKGLCGVPPKIGSACGRQTTPESVKGVSISGRVLAPARKRKRRER